MKKLFLISLLFLNACASLQNDKLRGQKYVVGTEDIPVYENFKPADTKNIAYDSEGGRIVNAGYFSNQGKLSDVQKFYSETLSQLGWKKKKSHEYIRDGESMKITITEKGGIIFLQFTIRPLRSE